MTQKTPSRKATATRVAESEPPAPSIRWTGENRDDVVEFCGGDPLGQPAANFGREWNPVFGKEMPRLTIYNDVHHTTYPVPIGYTIVRGPDGLRPVDVDTGAYEHRHEGEGG